MNIQKNLADKGGLGRVGRFQNLYLHQFCLNITHVPNYTSNYSPAMQHLSRVPLVANHNANVSST